ncbi:DNA-binding transcriptional MerR regulator [Rhodoblastus acidophilus]|uniref:MerR family transcriptional regulator n=1 Tax=Rhodoblastus acidophilus TaxID=1074 RepID=UPI00222484B7|nr:MerR family transcriptional regulator [Rhodoblastus acidophilus]MCW2284893.1 DNA-binding transcriptional MerR regulator [Rhodoblastus acidophilus]MCW2333817.1 DNA-binding transcriptional MerR regulator [Rhodoblastus acidophilus]
MDKTTEAFRTIGEVAEELDLPQHVLRFWETKFTAIRPVKRAGGRRYYRPDDIALVAAIRVLLYSEGYTIKGVQRILKEQGIRAVLAASAAPRGATPLATGLALRASTDAALAGTDTPAPASDAGLVARLSKPAALASGVTSLSMQDRHRLEAILAELTECARLLA